MSETCYAYPSPVFQPAMRIIANITRSNPAIVTTTFDHNYITGTIIRLIVPPGHGMDQADQLFGPIVVTSSTTFAISIDTTSFNPFVIPDTPGTCAQTIAIGEINSLLAAAEQNVLPYRAT